MLNVSIADWKFKRSNYQRQNEHLYNYRRVSSTKESWWYSKMGSRIATGLSKINGNHVTVLVKGNRGCDDISVYDNSPLKLISMRGRSWYKYCTGSAEA